MKVLLFLDKLSWRFCHWLHETSSLMWLPFDYERYLVLPFCWLLGHAPEQDQCRKPEHDYCARCFSATPNQAKRGA